jgi:hypothetical protein
VQFPFEEEVKITLASVWAVWRVDEYFACASNRTMLSLISSLQPSHCKGFTLKLETTMSINCRLNLYCSTYCDLLRYRK